MVISDRQGWQFGMNVELESVNSAHLRNPKKARQNMASRV